MININEQGLYQKYIVSKSDGSPANPEAEYIVLRIDTDRYARMAIRYYANRLLRDEKYSKFAEDLIKRCDYYWMKEQGFSENEINSIKSMNISD